MYILDKMYYQKKNGTSWKIQDEIELEKLKITL